jgi:beta-glucanase (GH16 family)
MKKRLIAPFCLFMTLVSCQKNATDEITQVNIDNTPTEVAVMSLPSTPTIPPPPYGYTWGTPWIDNFDNLDNWTAVTEDKDGTKLETDLKFLYKRPDMVSVSNGILSLSSKKTSYQTMRCGSVSTEGKKNIKYGYFVARIYIQNPTTLGSQTSFWSMYPRAAIDVTGANDGAEMDVFESSFIGEKVQSGTHWDWHTDPYLPKHTGIASWIAKGATTGYHDYGLLWTPGRLEIYYDGVKQGASFLDRTKISNVWQHMLLGTAYAWGDAKSFFNSAPLNTVGVTKVDLVQYVPFQ